jgi:hypothetical protein
MGEFVDRNVGRLHYHFHESLKDQWRDLWRRIEEVLRRLEHSLDQAASTLAQEEPDMREGIAAIDAVLDKIRRITGLLDETGSEGEAPAT